MLKSVTRFNFVDFEISFFLLLTILSVRALFSSWLSEFFSFSQSFFSLLVKWGSYSLGLTLTFYLFFWETPLLCLDVLELNSSYRWLVLDFYYYNLLPSEFWLNATAFLVLLELLIDKADWFDGELYLCTTVVWFKLCLLVVCKSLDFKTWVCWEYSLGAWIWYSRCLCWRGEVRLLFYAVLALDDIWPVKSML